MYSEDSNHRLRHKFADGLEHLEATYLRILRAAILVIATLLVVAAVILAAYSVFRMSRSADSVQEEPAAVAAAEIVDAEQPAEATPAKGRDQLNPYYREYYNRFIARYHALFRNRFEPFRQREDKRLSVTEFGDSFILPTTRLEAIKKGELEFEADKADLES